MPEALSKQIARSELPPFAAVVSQIRLPEMTGDERPSPGTADFHVTFFSSFHSRATESESNDVRYLYCRARKFRSDYVVRTDLSLQRHHNSVKRDVHDTEWSADASKRGCKQTAVCNKHHFSCKKTVVQRARYHGGYGRHTPVKTQSSINNEQYPGSAWLIMFRHSFAQRES